MIKKLFLVCLILLTLSACSSERRGIRQMHKLTNDIELYGANYSIQDWQDTYEDFKAIDASIDPKKLSPAQRQEYTELKGRAVAGFAKSSVKSITSSIGSYINSGIGIIEGLIEGLTK